MTTNLKILNLDLYKKIYLTRMAENKIIDEYMNDEMKTPMHMSMGEEAIVAGVCHALGKNSDVLGTYRSHAIYLSKTEEVDQFFGELYGKETGSAKGIAGSMHLSAPESGYLGASAVVGTNIPVAVGVAFANKKNKNKRLAAAFFGDGASDEGVFWESLNMACLWKLPILFIHQDNDLAIHTSKKDRKGYNSILEIVKKYNCNVYKSNTTDVEEIYNLTLKALKDMTRNQKPIFMDMKYYRYLEHVGINDDFHAGYRKKSEFQKWHKRDPIKLQRNKLVKLGLTKKVEEIEKNIINQIEKSIKISKNAKFPNLSELHKNTEA